MSDRQKLQEILGLLSESNVEEMIANDQLTNHEEAAGALVFAVQTFKKAIDIVERK